MLNGKRFLAIIPARGGSKRVPRKNVLPLCGKPLIAWTIEAALKSRYIDDVVVTTDDKEIAEVSIQSGASVPFIRPAELSDDHAKRGDVIRHAVLFCTTQQKKQYDYIIYLQPTSPLRRAAEIDKAVEYLFARNADAVVSMCEVEYPMQWCSMLDESRSMTDFIKSLDAASRSQDIPSYFRLNGAIYICDIAKFLKKGDVFIEENIFAYLMPTNISVDIDTKLDFAIAETVMNDLDLADAD